MKQAECLKAERIGELRRLTVDRLHPLAAGRRAQSLESGATGACGLHPPHRRPTSRPVVEHQVFDHWGRFVARGHFGWSAQTGCMSSMAVGIET